MRFKLEEEKEEIELLEREAYRDLYVKTIKNINKMKRQRRKKSETMGKASETHEGTKSNANHKSDMDIMKLNMRIKTQENRLETIDKKFEFNLFENNLILYNENKKIIEEYKGEK